MGVRKTLNLSQLQITSLRKRTYRLEVEHLAEMPDPAKPLADFFRSLPRTARVEEFHRAATCLAHAAGGTPQRDVVWLVDAEFVEAGLSPILVHLVQRGVVQAVAMTGGAALRDFEIAYHGKTCEDIQQGIEEGALGLAREVGEGINLIVNDGVKRGFGLGECLGRGILDRRPRWYNRSILAACAARVVTATVHVAIGEEGFHLHPSGDPSLLGKGSAKDFQALASRVEGLADGGVVMSLHRSQSLQQVFHHAFAVARNLGAKIDRFSMIRFERDGRFDAPIPGLAEVHSVPGPLEIMFPLFAGQLFSLAE